MFLRIVLALLGTLRASTQTTQQQAWSTPHDASLNATSLSLNSLSDSEFTVLGHPSFPTHAVRIKKSSKGWCDPTVSSYTGYIDTNDARHIFFYFFESRNDPDTDDVILWTNGGPGCSSSLGLFMELGPCSIKDDNGTTFNPYSWNEKANILFIDQPIGVGFSYADYGEFVSTTEEAAFDIAAFVSIFFSTFSKFTGRAFHMAGESYGGRYIPVYASAVYENNKDLKAAGFPEVNLQSIMIGNGITDFYHMIPSYYDLQCTTASLDVPPGKITDCVRMKTSLPRCKAWLKESCVDTFDRISCSAASSFCHTELSGPLWSSGLNPYDISKQCDGPISETLCYPITRHIVNYLNSPETRLELGVSPTLSNLTFRSCSSSVGSAFSEAMDGLRSQTQFYLEALLERDLRVLIYAGTYDWICNWLGNQRMVDALQWNGAEEFKERKLRPWSASVSGKDGQKKGGEVRTGQVKSNGGLTFLTVEGAGHMVPYDKPVEALDMVNRWLAGEQF